MCHTKGKLQVAVVWWRMLSLHARASSISATCSHRMCAIFSVWQYLCFVCVSIWCLHAIRLPFAFLYEHVRCKTFICPAFVFQHIFCLLVPVLRIYHKNVLAYTANTHIIRNINDFVVFFYWWWKEVERKRNSTQHTFVCVDRHCVVVGGTFSTKLMLPFSRDCYYRSTHVHQHTHQQKKCVFSFCKFRFVQSFCVALCLKYIFSNLNCLV